MLWNYKLVLKRLEAETLEFGAGAPPFSSILSSFLSLFLVSLNFLWDIGKFLVEINI